MHEPRRARARAHRQTQTYIYAHTQFLPQAMCVEAGLPTAGSSGVLEQQSRALPAHNKPSGDDLLGAGEGGVALLRLGGLILSEGIPSNKMVRKRSNRRPGMWVGGTINVYTCC